MLLSVDVPLSEQDCCVLEDMGIPGTNRDLNKAVGCFKERTSNGAPTMQGTEGMPCSEDQDRMLKTKLFLPGRYMLTKHCVQWNNGKNVFSNLLNK